MSVNLKNTFDVNDIKYSFRGYDVFNIRVF